MSKREKKRTLEAQKQKEIDAAKAQAREEYKQSLSEIEKRAADAADRAKELEKKLSIVGNSDTLAFNIHFEELSANFNKLLGLLIKIQASDAETAVKLQGAMRKYISLIDDKVSGAV